MSRFALPLLLVLLPLTLSACQLPVQISSVDSHRLPERTPHYQFRPEQLADRLDQHELVGELSRARRLENLRPQVAAQLYLRAAERAYHAILDPQTPPADRTLLTRELYNRAVAGYLELRPPAQALDPLTLTVGPGTWSDPAHFDQLIPAGDLQITGFFDHHIEPGLGAALVGYRANPDQTPLDDLYPPEGITRPVTAVIRFPDDAGPTLTLYDPRQTKSINLRPDGEASPASRLIFPLAADYTASYAELLSRANGLVTLGFAAMLNPDEAEDRLGIYLLEPYDPQKTPLLMVHGLMSTPLTWIQLTNEIYADPVLRQQYQVWHFLYPTATCPYYSAFYLREKLAATRALLDPEGDDPASRDMVVVGHSMGGILTRTLVSDTGQDAWNIAFTVPPDQLEGDPKTIDFLKSVYIYDARPYVRRVIFVATPHRGSDFANNFIGLLGRSLVRLPEECNTKTIAVARANRDKLQPGYGPWLLNGPPSAIKILRPESPASAAPDLIPIRPGVTFHSIIGTQNPLPPGTDPATTSDGIVAYWSSHLQGASSEVLVATGHNAHEHPVTVDEVKRILHDHLDFPPVTDSRIAGGTP